jgi:hypothetical protein
MVLLGLLNLYFGSFHLQNYQTGKIHTLRRISLKILKDTLSKTTDKEEEIKLLKIIKLYKIYLGLWLIAIILIVITILEATRT